MTGWLAFLLLIDFLVGAMLVVAVQTVVAPWIAGWSLSVCLP